MKSAFNSREITYGLNGLSGQLLEYVIVMLWVAAATSASIAPCQLKISVLNPN